MGDTAINGAGQSRAPTYKSALIEQPAARPDDVAGLFSAAAYLAAFQPIETIVDGLPIPRGGLVSLTAPTGHCKTTITALLELALVRGERFAGRETTAGSVLVLAGENPDDWAMHYAATLQDAGIEPKAVKNRVTRDDIAMVPGVFNVTYALDYLTGAVPVMFSNLVAVIVDTSAAFYLADDENSNTDMRRHAAALRELCTLPGRPAVIVLCHPTKNAQRDNLIPRGGGAFLAEVDANLTLWKDESGIVTLSWAGKIRGQSFEPVRFELASVTLEKYCDSRGRPVQSVAARHVPDERAEQLRRKEMDDTDVLMLTMLKNPGATVRTLALKSGWVGSTMQPSTGRIDRRMKTLAEHRLAEQDHKGTWRLTAKGVKAAEQLR